MQSTTPASFRHPSLPPRPDVVVPFTSTSARGRYQGRRGAPCYRTSPPRSWRNRTPPLRGSSGGQAPTSGVPFFSPPGALRGTFSSPSSPRVSLNASRPPFDPQLLAWFHGMDGDNPPPPAFTFTLAAPSAANINVNTVSFPSSAPSNVNQTLIWSPPLSVPSVPVVLPISLWSNGHVLNYALVGD